MKYPTFLAITLSTVLLAACGGGGSDATPATTATYPLEAAYTKAMTNGISLNGTAIDGADTYTLSLSITPAADEVFEGVVRKKSIEALTIKKNGAVLTATNIDGYYSTNPFIQWGARYSDGTYAVQTSSTGVFPTTAKVGDSGSLGTLTLYTNANKTTVQLTTQSTWTLEADTATTAFGCANSVMRDATGVQIGTAAMRLVCDSPSASQVKPWFSSEHHPAFLADEGCAKRSFRRHGINALLPLKKPLTLLKIVAAYARQHWVLSNF